MIEQKSEQPRKKLMWFLTPFMVLFSVFMFFFFSTDEWTTARVIGQIAFTLMAFGMVVTTLFPAKGWWGIRIVTFVIFSTYLGYFINQFVIQGNILDPTVSRSAASPFNALLGLLAFGIPSLMYTLWGSVWGKTGINNDNPTKSDLVSFYISWGSQWLFLGLTLISTIYAVWRWVQS